MTKYLFSIVLLSFIFYDAAAQFEPIFTFTLYARDALNWNKLDENTCPA